MLLSSGVWRCVMKCGRVDLIKDSKDGALPSFLLDLHFRWGGHPPTQHLLYLLISSLLCLGLNFHFLQISDIALGPTLMMSSQLNSGKTRPYLTVLLSHPCFSHPFNATKCYFSVVTWMNMVSTGYYVWILGPQLGKLCKIWRCDLSLGEALKFQKPPISSWLSLPSACGLIWGLLPACLLPFSLPWSWTLSLWNWEPLLKSSVNCLGHHGFS